MTADQKSAIEEKAHPTKQYDLKSEEANGNDNNLVLRDEF